MDFHKQFMEFTATALRSDWLDRDTGLPDLHDILAPLADGDEIYEFMGAIPDDRIAEVLGFAMGLGTDLD